MRGGSVLWHGHPSELTEEAIREVLQGGTIATKSAAEPAGPSKEVVAYRKARLEILGLLRAKQADQALALIAEKEAILSAIDPADPDVLCGMAYSVEGKREQSLAHYRKAVEAAGGDAGALFRVAHGLLDYGTVRDADLALQCARDAVAKDDSHYVRHMLARCENAAGNRAAAIAILEKIAREEDSEAYREELRALRDDGQIPETYRRGVSQ